MRMKYEEPKPLVPLPYAGKKKWKSSYPRRNNGKEWTMNLFSFLFLYPVLQFTHVSLRGGTVWGCCRQEDKIVQVIIIFITIFCTILSYTFLFSLSLSLSVHTCIHCVQVATSWSFFSLSPLLSWLLLWLEPLYSRGCCMIQYHNDTNLYHGDSPMVRKRDLLDQKFSV